MPVGLLTLELHIPDAQSLKDKRQVLRSLKDKLRRQFNVAVAELDHHDVWQRSVVGVVTLSNEEKHVQEVLQKVLDEADRILGSFLISQEIRDCLGMRRFARDGNESNQSPTRTRGRGNRARNQRHAGRRAEGSAARRHGGGQRSARAAGHEACARLCQRAGHQQRTERRDQGAGACFGIHSQRADRALAAAAIAGASFHARSFAGDTSSASSSS